MKTMQKETNLNKGQTYEDIEEFSPQDSTVKEKPLEDKALSLRAAWEEIFALAVLLGQVDNNGTTLVHLEVPIHNERNVMLWVELK